MSLVCEATAVPVTLAEAYGLVARGERVHTFERRGVWVGADMDRAQILAAIEVGRLALSTECGWAGHWLAVEANGRRLLIETDDAALSRIRERLGLPALPGARMALKA